MLLKSKTDQLIEIDKVSYEESMAAERSTGKLFKHFRAFRKSVLPSIMHYQNENADTDVSKAALFSKFFASVYVESSIFNENECSNKNQPILENINFSEQDIFEICKLLNVNKSKGPDDLLPFLFKNAETLSHSIYRIFRKISQTCIFPTCWKKAIISPLHKKDDKSDIENYRPVSLLSVISKILEQIIFKRLYEHFEKIFHKAQYGFRKNRSTIVELLTFLQLVYNGHENGDSIETVFTDYSKAFDRVDHGILLRKLFEQGVRDKNLKLIKSYLTERSQVVRVNGEISNSEKVTSGVPQGSILGPLFFLVFIYDLPDKCNTVIPFLFADEAKFISINLGRDEFQKDLDNVNLWTLENNMPFNVDKCTHLNFGKNRFSFKFNNEQIAHVDCQKDLGLIVSNDLTWSQHMEKACVKANRVFFMIKRNTSNLHWKAKLNLYKSMVIPVIMYASSCIGLNKYVMTQYEIIQKRAVNWILQ